MKVKFCFMLFIDATLRLLYPGGGAQCGSGYLIVYGRWRYIESRAGDRQRVRDADREK